MTALLGTEQIEKVRFRDDEPDLFGVELGDGPCDETYSQSLRDHLSHSVEVVPSLFPGVARVVDEVRDMLLPEQPCRAFVSGDPAPQAYCMGGSKDHTVIIGLTSGLVELMSDAELAFVVGHEIGHHLMGHHRRMRPNDDSVQSINFRSLQRMGEISADRVGFLASPSSEAAFRAILKTATGLGDAHLRFDFAAFNDQLHKLKKADGAGDARATHPLFTVRCRALHLFEESDVFFATSDKPGRPVLSQSEMDNKIASDMTDSTGYHPVAEMEKSVRKALIWVVLRLFIDDQKLCKPEQAFLRDNFDPDIADAAIDFVRQHGPEAVCRKYEDALDKLSQMKEIVRYNACEVLRRVASVAGGSKKQRITLLRHMHTALSCNDRVVIEPWDDEHSLADLVELH